MKRRTLIVICCVTVIVAILIAAISFFADGHNSDAGPAPSPRPASTNKWMRFLKNWMHWGGNRTAISESLICQQTLPQMRGAAMKKRRDTSTPSQKPSFTASNKHAPPALQRRRGTCYDL